MLYHVVQMLPMDQTPLGFVAENLHDLTPLSLSNGRFQLRCAARSRLLWPEDARKQSILADEMVLCQGLARCRADFRARRISCH
jgi:hypothetical protein